MCLSAALAANFLPQKRQGTLSSIVPSPIINPFLAAFNAALNVAYCIRQVLLIFLLPLPKRV
jgi:hypothetical protein